MPSGPLRRDRRAPSGETLAPLGAFGGVAAARRERRTGRILAERPPLRLPDPGHRRLAAHDRAGRRVRLPERRSGPGAVPRTLRPRTVHNRQRVFPQDQPERRRSELSDLQRPLGRRERARPGHGFGGLPVLSHHPRGGIERSRERHGRGREHRRRPGCHRDLEQLRDRRGRVPARKQLRRTLERLRPPRDLHHRLGRRQRLRQLPRRRRIAQLPGLLSLRGRRRRNQPEESRQLQRLERGSVGGTRTESRHGQRLQRLRAQAGVAERHRLPVPLWKRCGRRRGLQLTCVRLQLRERRLERLLRDQRQRTAACRNRGARIQLRTPTARSGRLLSGPGWPVRRDPGKQRRRPG